MLTDNTEPSLTSNVINNQNYSTVTETSNMVLNKPFKTMSAPENISTSQSEVKYGQIKFLLIRQIIMLEVQFFIGFITIYL